MLFIAEERFKWVYKEKCAMQRICEDKQEVNEDEPDKGVNVVPYVYVITFLISVSVDSFLREKAAGGQRNVREDQGCLS